MRNLNALISAFFLSFPVLFGQQIYFVNQSAINGQQNGLSWQNAFVELKPALDAAVYGDEIWVARGTYYPTNATNRSISFELKNGVKLLGGFSGTETNATQRSPEINPTRLSGNIGDTTLNTDNSYHVLRGRGLDVHTLLDGFIISDGYSKGATDTNADAYGAGLFLVGSSTLSNSQPGISNCLFEQNWAGSGGGAIYVGLIDPDDPSQTENLVNPVIKKCLFDQNHAQINGGAILKDGPTGTNDTFLIEDCRFIQNTAFALDGGGIIFDHSFQSNIFIKRCFFELNYSTGGTGGGFCLPTYSSGLYTTNLVLDSCVFNKNSATDGGGFSYDGRSFGQPNTVMNLQMNDCVFEENDARNANGSAFLVTIASNGLLSAEIKNCQFVKNQANSYFTAAFLCYEESEGNILLEQCVFLENINRNGSKIYCAAFDAGGSKVNTRINNCLFARNGAALFSGGDAQAQVLTQITNCTFYKNGYQPFGKRWYPSFNQPGAQHYIKMNFLNCAIWEPEVDSYLFYNNDPTNINAFWFYLNYCTFHPLIPATIPNYQDVLGDSIFIGEYPDFVDTLANDFRLKTCSPAMNRGLNQGVLDANLVTDLDGHARIRFSQVDIGAYETQDSCFTIKSMEPTYAIQSALIAPNPAAPGTLLHIQLFDEGPMLRTWNILDAYGRVITSGNSFLSTENLLFLEAPQASGLYFVEIHGEKMRRYMKLIVD